MGKKTTSLSSLGEPLFLGLSCIVGGEQFYILLYGTEVSIRAQSSVLVVTAIITCILLSSLTNREEVLAHLFHLFYIFLLVSMMITSNDIISGWVLTITILFLGSGLTVLVIQSCSLYSTSRQELLSFILGLFSARYLPSFFRHFVDKSASHDAQIRSVSRALGISRLLFCIISLALKILMGRFQLTFTESITVKYEEKSTWKSGLNKSFWEKLKSKMEKIYDQLKKPYEEITSFAEKSFKDGFVDIWNHTKYLIDSKVFHEEKPEESFYTRYLTPFLKVVPIILFLKSVLIFLMYPRTRFSPYCSYSTNVLSIIVNIKMLSHIMGSLLGIGFPMSVTSNSPFFTLVTFFFYFLWAHYLFHKASSKYFEDYLIYIMVGCSSFVLGYIWSYNLGIVINMVLRETCVYEELETIDKNQITWKKVTIKMKKSCCGDKITSNCYCKLERKVKMLTPDTSKKIFDCSKLFKQHMKRFNYSKDGKCAVLFINGINGSKCDELIKCCDRECGCSDSCTPDCCLKVIGIYKLEAVTVSSCSVCQLTIRLEGSCRCGPGGCTKCCGSGGPCTCNENGQCCCLCLKCCTSPPPNGCCCIHFCKNCKNKCKCNKDNWDVRVFICYEVKDKKCCVKEIRPNEKADFVGDLRNKNVFDIQDIFISDCCHVDIRVDLRCSVKNNYFRLSGANYPRKFEKPDLLSLLWSESVCCPDKKPQCCCMFRSLVRGCLMFIGSTWKCRDIKKCAINCKCNNKECCIMPCDLILDSNGGFVKRVNRIRVKLVVIAWLVFGLVFFIVALIAAPINKKYSPRRFCPTTSYSKLAGTLVTNKYNSEEQVTNRMVSLLENGKISDEVMEEKKQELRAMLSMFAKYSGTKKSKPEKAKTGISKWVSRKPKPREIDKIRDHIVNKAARFTPSGGVRRFEVCLVEWSQCVGLVYKYAMPLFFVIQKFFVAWEEAWRIDLRNFRREIMPYFMKVTHKSRVSLSAVMGESNVGDKCNESGLNRLVTWNKAFKEVKQFSRVTLKEDQVSEESVPLKIGNRLHYYIARWNHRLPNIRAWCNFDSNVFDWVNFLNEYERIRQWVSDVSPGLRCDSEVKVSTKDLNKGIQIFVTSK